VGHENNPPTDDESTKTCYRYAGVTHTWINDDDTEEPLEVGGGGCGPKRTTHGHLVPGSEQAPGASNPWRT
jgi:hypothetical protein